MTDKRKLQERNLRKIEKELNKDVSNMHCFFFPLDMKREYHHILPKSQFSEFIDCKENLIPVGTSAHWTLTFGTGRQLQNLPKFKEYLEKMKALNQQYYYRFCLNHKIKT